MNDIKKVLIGAICVVLVIGIVAGVSIGVLANTVTDLKEQLAEVNSAQESQNAMIAEIETAIKNNENLVTAEEFEAKLSAALGDQTQTMQSLINAAVKNEIADLNVEGLTEAQVNEIINAAVANCLTEDEINEIIANSNTGLTEAEVKKLITNANAGYLTYAQIVNLIDDNTYDLRKYLEDYIGGVSDNVQENHTLLLTLDAADAVDGVYTLDKEQLNPLMNYGFISLAGEGWEDITLVIEYSAEKWITQITGAGGVEELKGLIINAPKLHINMSDFTIPTVIIEAVANDNCFNFKGEIGQLFIEKGTVVLGYDTDIEEINLETKDADLVINDGAYVEIINANANDVAFTLESGSFVEEIVINAKDVKITNHGEVGKISVESGSYEIVAGTQVSESVEVEVVDGKVELEGDYSDKIVNVTGGEGTVTVTSETQIGELVIAGNTEDTVVSISAECGAITLVDDTAIVITEDGKVNSYVSVENDAVVTITNNSTEPVIVAVADADAKENVTVGETGTGDVEVRVLVPVSSADALKDAIDSNEDVNNNVIVLESDIALTEEWTPIVVHGYTGAKYLVIDGQGKTITGLSAPLVHGGFAGESGVIIRNLTIADSDIVSTNEQGSGAFLECIDSMQCIILDNCHLINSTLTGSRTGGLIGWTAGYNNVNDGPVDTYVTIINCSVKDCDITGEGSVGGLVGHSGANAATYTTIENCTVEGNNLTAIDDGDFRIGAYVGTANIGETTIINCTSKDNTIVQKAAADGDAVYEADDALYGRAVLGSTGKLIIEGDAIADGTYGND